MSTLDLEPYQHEPLEPGSIRLLLIRWAKSSDDLQCGIYHAVPGTIDYTAVSYAWEYALDNEEMMDIPMFDIISIPEGDSMKLAASDVPRRFLRVKKSLWKMVLSLGKIEEDMNLSTELPNVLVTVFWIDQVCINQSDTAEKSEQVKRMHQIYAEADSTAVYLGEPSEKTSIALEAAYALATLDKMKDDEIPYESDGGDEAWRRPVKRLDWAAIRDFSTDAPGYFEFLFSFGNCT